VWICGRRTASAAIAGAIAVSVAGCGARGLAQDPVPKRATVADACKQHRSAAAVVVSGLVDYKTYMNSEDPAFLLTFAKSGIANRVQPAIKTLETASGSAALSGAGKRFFKDLDRLESWLKTPAAVPTAVVGHRNASTIETAAKSVGCAL
jgi:hypothetical protein